jgi:hypothetical protein
MTAKPDLAEKYAERAWNLANAIAGFCALQDITWSTTVHLSEEISDQLTRPSGWIVALALILIFHIGYFCAVGVLRKKELALLGISETAATSSPIAKLISSADCGRKLVVVAFGVISFLAIVRYCPFVDLS